MTHRIAALRNPRLYRDTFGALFFGLHRVAMQRLSGGQAITIKGT